MEYWISKNPKGKWEIARHGGGSVTPAIGTYPSKKAAITTARLLAGRAGKVFIATK